MLTELPCWSYLKKTLHVSSTIFNVLLLISLFLTYGTTQTAFRTTWKTDYPGTSGNTEITIPTYSGLTYNYDADWDNNGTWDETGITGSVTHDFGSAGYKTIRIRGDFPRIYFNNGGDALKFINILEWGDVEWTSMERAFYGCRNMTCTAADAPDLSEVTSMAYMFSACDNLEGDFSGWETGTVTNMSYLFWGADIFNSDIGNWDVSNVTNMFDLFAWAFGFNQDLSDWDVSNVTNMGSLFRNATAFDQSLGDWTLNSSVSLSYMLSDCGMSCENYDLTLKGWYHNPSTPDNRSLGADGLNFWNSQWEHHEFENDRGWNISGDNFSNCSYGPADGLITTWKTDNTGTTGNNQIFIPASGTGYDYAVDWDNDGVLDQFDLTGAILHTYPSSGTYIVRVVGDFPRIYFNGGGDCRKLIGINQWGDIKWSSMESAFDGCINMTCSATDAPDLSGVTSLKDMFGSCQLFDADLSGWETQTITEMSYMFDGARAFNGNIGGWNVGNVTNMEWMFFGAISFDQDISCWNVSNVTHMEYMFGATDVFNQDISGWNVGQVTSMKSMFYYALDFNQDIGSWNVSMVTDLSSMLQGAAAFDHYLGDWSLNPDVNLSGLLNNCGISCEHYDQTIKAWHADSNTPDKRSLGAEGVNFYHSQIERHELIADKGWTITGDSYSNCAYEPGTEFITTWKTDNPGSSTFYQITIPTTGSGYDYAVDWNNDGELDEFDLTGNVTHSFGTPGNQTIRIVGNFPQIYFNNSDDCAKLISIDQWGDNEWTSMENAFYGCYNMTLSATDTPDLSGITNMAYLFAGCELLDTDLFAWDVSTITDMNHLFSNAYAFNGNLANWNVSTVTDMSHMFAGAGAFDQDIGGWNTSNVSNMEAMFSNALAFNQFLNNWDVSKVTSFSGMFSGASSFDQSLNKWNLNSATDVSYMLDNCGMSCEQYDYTLIGWDANLNTPDNLELGATNLYYWQAQNARIHLTNQSGKNWTINGDNYSECNYFRPFITTWKTDNPGTSGNTQITIPTYSGLTYSYDVDWDNDGTYEQTGISGNVTHDFGAPGTYTIRIRGNFPRIINNYLSDQLKLINIDQWGDIAWASMANAFFGCRNMTCSAVDAPDLSVVTSLASMFKACDLLNSDFPDWETGNVTDMSYLFNGADLFNGDIGNWDVSKVINMESMFNAAYAFNQDIGDWNVSNVTNMREMFYEASAFNQDIGGWRVYNVTDMWLMFNYALNFDQNLGDWIFNEIVNISNMLGHSGISCENYDKSLIGWSDNPLTPDNLDLDNVPANYWLAKSARYNLKINKYWSIYDNGFNECNYFDPLITTWSEQYIIIWVNNSYDYHYAVDWDNDGSFDEYGITGNKSHTFESPGPHTIRIAGKFPGFYFSNQNGSTYITDIVQWGEVEWETMEGAFLGCTNLTCTASDFPDLSRVNKFEWAFKDCENFNTDLSLCDVSNGINFREMFFGAEAFNQNLGNWSLNNASNLTSMLSNSGLSRENYDVTLTGWYNNPATPSYLSLGAEGLHYCLSETERQALIDDMDWNITGDSRNCPCTPVAWNGGTETGYWDVPEKWNPSFVPSSCNDISLTNATDILTIPASYAASAKSLYNTGTVHILNTGSLTLSDASGYGLQNYGGALTNDGILNILNPGSDGLRNENGGTFTNTLTGVMNISDATGIGLVNIGKGTFMLNTGMLTISNPGLKHLENLDDAVLTVEGTLRLEN